MKKQRLFFHIKIISQTVNTITDRILVLFQFFGSFLKISIAQYKRTCCKKHVLHAFFRCFRRNLSTKFVIKFLHFPTSPDRQKKLLRRQWIIDLLPPVRCLCLVQGVSCFKKCSFYSVSGIRSANSKSAVMIASQKLFTHYILLKNKFLPGICTQNTDIIVIRRNKYIKR